jgi:hypothetical protein
VSTRGVPSNASLPSVLAGAADAGELATLGGTPRFRIHEDP